MGFCWSGYPAFPVLVPPLSHLLSVAPPKAPCGHMTRRICLGGFLLSQSHPAPKLTWTASLIKTRLFISDPPPPHQL
ncbi:hypothetical protein FQA47_005681 [Oryzias melastigma]|uniref:Uncharacterized protein n=1 Tax=Oryzias melastigma TaxID=30732 RepID=A0A834BVW0_ORYME|nr:hypothetical protein FQA47_005681 [Oryzias melastigma]